MNDSYAAVRAAMRQDSPFWRIEHVDITCDGCEREPIVGKRFKCTVCEDIDLCGNCMRALVAARVKMAQEAAPQPAARQQQRRPRKWVSKLHSKDLSQKWAALQTAVPCLHPSHQFARIVDGPERAVVFTPLSEESVGGRGAVSDQQQEQQQHEQQRKEEEEQQHVEQQQTHQKMQEVCSEGGADRSSQLGTREGLEKFLQTFRPSTSSCRDVAWIVVDRPDAASTPQQQQQQQQRQRPQQEPVVTAEDERVDAAVEEWEQVVRAAAKAGRRLTAADVEALAVKHRILKGKWMLFARSGAEADAAWAAVARGVCAQPPLCSSAKVSSAGPDGDASWVLLAYTRDCTDREDVQRVRRRLQQAIPPGLLQDRRLLYKADIYTHLGIYSKNEWQLKPTVYEAWLA